MTRNGAGGNRRNPWVLALFGSLVLPVALVSACSSVSIGPEGGPTATPIFYPDDTPYNGPAPGAWSGTITFHGAINVNKTEPGHSDLDPSNAYYQTWVTTEVTQLDATDTFTIAAVDEYDPTYGIRPVDLGGTATNSGTTLQRYVTVWDKGNSGCAWNEEDGSETAGSWSGNGNAVGELNFEEDGSYWIRIRADAEDQIVVPHHDWLKYTDISANCEVNQPEYDNPDDGFPLVGWVSDHLEDSDVNLMDADIEGELNPSNPGSVVDGASTWEMRSPEGFTMTITWHLVHEGPIVLPHS